MKTVRHLHSLALLLTSLILSSATIYQRIVDAMLKADLVLTPPVVYVWQHKCYIVATCDRDLKRRIRKIPGVPIMYIRSHRYSIERLPEATMGGCPRT
jgi:rRNA-processing protein FCF1